jgi:hypothetical protein
VNLKLVAIHAPPAPKCFAARDIWVEYLHSAQQAAVGPKVKPFVDGRYNPQYPFCRDCPAKHAHAMFLAKRCDFKAYVISLVPAGTPVQMTLETADVAAS